MIHSHRTNSVILVIAGTFILFSSVLFLIDSECNDALKLFLLGSVLLTVSYLERKKSRYE